MSTTERQIVILCDAQQNIDYFTYTLRYDMQISSEPEHDMADGGEVEREIHSLAGVRHTKALEKGIQITA